MKNIVGIIPARYASSRFPGKPLAVIQGKTMIQRVFEQASIAKTLKAVYVATDDQRIYDHILAFTSQVVMTSMDHENGTSRCLEALNHIESKSDQVFDAVINIQGDEPFIKPEQIDRLAALFTNAAVEIGSLAKKIDSLEQLRNPNIVKAVFGDNKQAHYFSRQALPYLRDVDESAWLAKHDFYKHIGIYGYRSAVLRAIVSLKPGILEAAEKLEQLRWLENGFKIYIETTDLESIAVDSPEDLKKLMNIT